MKALLRKGARLLAVIVLVYVGLCIAARLLYSRLLFPAPALAAVPPEFDATIHPDFPHVVTIARSQGLPTQALWFGSPDARTTAVIFHGNGETMFDQAGFAFELGRRGIASLCVEYTGYGLGHGDTPTEDDLYRDGDGAIAFLAERGVLRDRVAAVGFSLGTSVAVEMGKRGKVSRLVLLAPFTSITEMGRRFVPFLPVELVLAHRLDSLSKASAIHVPSLIVHGDADEVVPFFMGEKLASAIEGATFMRVARGHHNDLMSARRSGTPTASAVVDAIAAHLTSR